MLYHYHIITLEHTLGPLSMSNIYEMIKLLALIYLTLEHSFDPIYE